MNFKCDKCHYMCEEPDIEWTGDGFDRCPMCRQTLVMRWDEIPALKDKHTRNSTFSMGAKN